MKWLIRKIAEYRYNHPQIVWNLPTKNPFTPKFELTADGRLLVDGFYMGEEISYPKAVLEGRLQRMLDNIRKANSPIAIRAIVIEPHVAIGWWTEGTLQHEHLDIAKEEDEWVSLQMEFLGQIYKVVIPTYTYFSSYEFWVNNHPDGTIRIRNIPDALAAAANEPIM